MICPILEISFRIARPGDTPLDTECLLEECARWDRQHGICGDLLEAQACDRIANYLEAIVDKMPHEGQFRK